MSRRPTVLTLRSTILALGLCLAVVACGSEQLATSEEQSDAATSIEEVSATNQAGTTTIALPDGIEPGESTPSDYSNPATLPELEGLTLAEAEEQARGRGWTTIETYTDEDYSSRSFDADLDVTRLRVIYDPDTGLVLEANVG